MKNSLIGTKNRLIFCTALFLLQLSSLSSLWASGAVENKAYVVDDMRGTVFAVDGQEVWEIQRGDYLKKNIEIITEVGGQVSLRDFHDHVYHLSSGGNLKFIDQVVELRRGFLWVQSLNTRESYAVRTANAQADFTAGECIISFDSVASKSQILVLGGRFGLQNVLNSYSRIELTAGQFSFVSPHYNSGHPRKGTPIGFGSYQKIRELFIGVRPYEGNNLSPSHPNQGDAGGEAGRSLAGSRPPMEGLESSNLWPKAKDFSALEKGSSGTRKGPRPMDLQNLYDEDLARLKMKKKIRNKKIFADPGKVKVKIFGQKSKNYFRPKKRVPKIKGIKSSAAASSPFKKSVKNNRNLSGKKDHGNFSNSLKKEYMRQMRHPNEVNQLIKELESFDQDYKRTY